MKKSTNNTLRGLVESLLAKARKGRLNWFSAASSSAYAVAFPSSAVTIRGHANFGAPGAYTLTILNSGGEEVTSISTHDAPFPNATTVVMAEGETHAAMLEELFELAHRKATAAEETIARVQAELAKA